MPRGALAFLATTVLHGWAFVALTAAHVERVEHERPPPLEWLDLAPPPEPEPVPEPDSAATAPPVSPRAAPRRAAPARVLTASATSEPTSAPVVTVPDASPTFTDFTATVLGGTPGPAVPAPAAAPAGPARPAPPRLVALGDLSQPPAPPDLTDALRRHYPAAARERGEEGTALVVVHVGPGGEVLRPRVVEASAPELGEACASVLRASRWSEPLDREGRRVTTVVRYRCEFRIR